jgi:hypothetical protein
VVEQIIGIVGGTAGMVSLAIVLYKTWKEKPRLSFTVEKTYWSIHTPQDPVFNPISISLRIDNKGDKGTTIYGTYLSFEYDHEHKTIKDDRGLSILVPPHETIRHLLNYYIKRNEFKIENNIKNATLTITYTHGQKKIEIPVIEEWK